MKTANCCSNVGWKQLRIQKVLFLWYNSSSFFKLKQIGILVLDYCLFVLLYFALVNNFTILHDTLLEIFINLRALFPLWTQFQEKEKFPDFSSTNQTITNLFWYYTEHSVSIIHEFYSRALRIWVAFNKIEFSHYQIKLQEAFHHSSITISKYELQSRTLKLGGVATDAT